MQKGLCVVLHEDNITPQHWFLASVMESMPDRDGKVNV